MAKERAKFEDGCERTGYGRDLGKQLFDIIEGFADYAFNKSHTFGYGLITYQTAYLKAHYPVEYLACLLTSVKSNLEKAAVYLADCRAMGIKVLTPDVNLLGVGLRGAAAGARCPPGVQLPAGLPRASSPSGCRRSATWARAWWRSSSRSASATVRSTRSTTSSSGSTRSVLNKRTRRVAHQGRRLRHARPPPQGPAAGLRADHRRHAAAAPGAGPGRDEPVRRPRRRRPTASTSERPSPTSSSTRRSACASRRRCSGCTSPTTRSWASRRRCGGEPTPASPTWTSARTARC